MDDGREGQLLAYPALQVICHLTHLPAPGLLFLHHLPRVDIDALHELLED